MAACALQANFTWSDLRTIKYTHLMLVLYEWEDLNGAEVDEVVDATTADVEALKLL